VTLFFFSLLDGVVPKGDASLISWTDLAARNGESKVDCIEVESLIREGDNKGYTLGV